MKRMLFAALILMAIILNPATIGAQGMAVPGELSVQYDPVGDVYEVLDGEIESLVPGHENLDIVQIEAKIVTEGALQTEYLVLGMKVLGNIVNTKDISYIFIFGTSSSDTFAVFCNQSEAGVFTVTMVNIQEGTLFIIPSLTQVSRSGGDLEVKISPSMIGNPSSLEAFRGITLDNRNPDRKLGDMAPDRLVRITSPSDGATIWYDSPSPGTYTFTGVCRKSQNNFERVEVSIDESSWTTVANSADVVHWSTVLDIGGLNGRKNLFVRATDSEGGVFEDSISFTVNNDYYSAASRPVFPGLKDMTVGDTFRYRSVGSPRLSGLDLSTTSSMEMFVEKVETLSIHGVQEELLKVQTSQEGTVVLGAFDMEQTIKRDSWRPVSDHQAVLKEYTETTQSVTKDGSPLNTVYTFTNLTYDQAFNPGYEGKLVGQWWSATSSGQQQTVRVDEEGGVETSTSSPTKTTYLELLSTRSVTTSEVRVLPSSQQGYVIKTSTGDNESAYTVLTFVEGFSVPVMVEAYDGNREKLTTLVLDSFVGGSGVFAKLEDVVWPSGAINQGQEHVFTAEVSNQGDSEGSVWASLRVDGNEVKNESTILTPGQSGVLELKWTPSAPGKYRVEVRTEHESFFREIEVMKPSSGGLNILIILSIVAAAAVVFLLAMLKRMSPTPKEKFDKNGMEEDTDRRLEEESEGVSIDGFEISARKKMDAGGITTAGASPKAQASLVSRGEEMSVKCTKCNSISKVFVAQKPYKFKCPECGAKLLLR